MFNVTLFKNTKVNISRPNILFTQLAKNKRHVCRNSRKFDARQ